MSTLLRRDFTTLFKERAEHWNKQNMKTSFGVPFSKAPILQWSCYRMSSSVTCECDNNAKQTKSSLLWVHLEVTCPECWQRNTQNLEVHTHTNTQHLKLSTVKQTNLVNVFRLNNVLLHWRLVSGFENVAGEVLKPNPVQQAWQERLWIQGHCWVFLDWAGWICSRAY